MRRWLSRGEDPCIGTLALGCMISKMHVAEYE